MSTKSSASAAGIWGTLTLITPKVPVTLHIEFEKVARDHGLTVVQGVHFLLRQAVNQQSLTAETERRAS